MAIRHGFMDHYKSPDSEQSIYKNIPMTLRHHPFVKGMLAVGCRVRYRGPRERGGYHTLKRDATRFSIYPPRPVRDKRIFKVDVGNIPRGEIDTFMERKYRQGPDN